MEINCADDCCRYGVDVLPEEYERIILSNLATPKEFTRPYKRDGELIYRTKLGKRGCVLLMPRRGCRLHLSGHKPITCQTFPKNLSAAKTAYQQGYLPCLDIMKPGP
jgi:Fe-S-cluster containining protein